MIRIKRKNPEEKTLTRKEIADNLFRDSRAYKQEGNLKRAYNVGFEAYNIYIELNRKDLAKAVADHLKIVKQDYQRIKLKKNPKKSKKKSPKRKTKKRRRSFI